MFRRILSFFAAGVIGVGTLYGQSPGPIRIDSDLRLFTVMTALNAAGFDVELGSQYHPVRSEARKLAEQLDPSLLARLKDFYLSHKRGQSDDTQLSKYISLAVNLSAPPDFDVLFREEFLPTDARDILGFRELLKEVYLQLRLSRSWSELQPQYEAEISRLGPAIREALVRTDAYLRVPLGEASVRTLDILVELSAPKNSVNVRSDQDNYYVVLGESTTSHIDDIRHAYLHFHLDRLISSNGSKIVNGELLLQLIKDVEGVQQAYSSDFYMMMTESVIRAVELRMDRMAPARAKEAVDGYYRSGLLLTPYFYESLLGYEAQEARFRSVFPDIASAVRVVDEQLRFTSTFMSLPVPARTTANAEVPRPEASPERDPVRELLKEGEAALNSNNDEKARTAFERVLNDYDRSNGAALYGLALISSRQGDSEQAQELFERTTRSDKVDPSMKVWAYVYLARIFDLQCEREKALANYQQALKMGDNTRNAQTAAREGIRKPYGDACGKQGL